MGIHNILFSHLHMHRHMSIHTIVLFKFKKRKLMKGKKGENVLLTKNAGDTLDSRLLQKIKVKVKKLFFQRWTVCKNNTVGDCNNNEKLMIHTFIQPAQSLLYETSILFKKRKLINTKSNKYLLRKVLFCCFSKREINQLQFLSKKSY